MPMASLVSQAIGVRPTRDPNVKLGIQRTGTRTARKAPAHIEMRGGKAVYISDAPSAICLVGYVGGQLFSLEDCSVNFPAFGNSFAAVTVTAMDRKPIRSSSRILLTLVGKVENQEMVWNAQRTSVGSKWGHGPTVAEGIPATLSLAAGSRHLVWALDGAGKRLGQVPANVEGGRLTFTVGPQYRTLWYEIAD
jgi:hypothetical protein